jgi:hypothetical protein
MSALEQVMDLREILSGRGQKNLVCFYLTINFDLD